MPYSDNVVNADNDDDSNVSFLAEELLNEAVSGQLCSSILCTRLTGLAAHLSSWTVWLAVRRL